MKTRARPAGTFIVLGLAAASLAAQSTTLAGRSATLLLEEAIARAQAQHKAIFVDFNASWCPLCQRLQAFLRAPEPSRVLDAHYVVLTLTVFEEGEKAPLNNPGAEDLFKKWGGANAIPFYVFLDSMGNKITSDIGYPGSKEDIAMFETAITKTTPAMPRAEVVTLTNYLATASKGVSSITGRVLDSQGKGVVNAQVSIVERGSTEGQWRPIRSRRVETNASGHYVLEDLKASDYTLMVEPPPSGAPVFYPSATSLGQAEHFALGPNQDLTGIDVVLPSPHRSRVSGIVLGSSDRALPRASVALTSVEWPWHTWNGSIDRSGTFSIADVPPGQYNLWALVDDRALSSDSPAAAGFLPVTVGPSDISNVGIPVQPRSILAGTLVVEGAPISPADRATMTVTAIATRAIAGEPRRTSTSSVRADGTFEIRGLFGARVIRVEGLPPGLMLERVTIDGNDVTDTPIDLAGGEHVTGIRVAITDHGAEVSGVALDDAGKPLRGGAVIVFADDARRWGHSSRFVKLTPIDSAGRFRIRALPSGHYLAASVESLERSWDSPETLERLRARASSLVLEEGMKRTLSLSSKPASDR